MSSLSRRCALAALALAGSLIAGTAVQAEGVLNVYNARHYGTDDQLWNGLTAATGIKVNVVSGSHDELIQRISLDRLPAHGRGYASWFGDTKKR